MYHGDGDRDYRGFGYCRIITRLIRQMQIQIPGHSIPMRLPRRVQLA